MATPACRARSSSDATAGTNCSRHFGWRAQMCSMTSKTSNAVVAGSITTGTGSGGDGICSVSKALLMENPPNPRCLAGLQVGCAANLVAACQGLGIFVEQAGRSKLVFKLHPLLPNRAGHASLKEIRDLVQYDIRVRI